MIDQAADHPVTTHDALEDPRNADILIYVDGVLKPRSQAMVSVYDSGFMLGDGVWEGLRLYDGVWAFLDEHLDRLFEAALAIDLDIGKTRDQVKQALEETRAANGMHRDAHARMMVTRGIKVKPFNTLACRARDRPLSSSWNTAIPRHRAAFGSRPFHKCAACLTVRIQNSTATAN